MDFAKQLKQSQEYFERSTQTLEESDSGFRPKPEMMSVAEQVAHTAQTFEWFLEGASRPEGFDLDFEKHMKATAAVKSLAAAREWFKKGCAKAIAWAESRTAEQLAAPLPAGPVMGGAPVSDIIWAMVEHTAHHRGALTVYARELGKTPPMPYGG